jgi:hypothetical protein
VTYRHADASRNYTAAISNCQFFQINASVKTNTMINLPHSQVEELLNQKFLDSFHPVRILGEGFRKVILVKKKASDGSDQHSAFNVMKKSHIVSSCSVTYTVAVKEALVLDSGHPFITTLYSCFQNKGTSLLRVGIRKWRQHGQGAGKRASVQRDNSPILRI